MKIQDDIFYLLKFISKLLVLPYSSANVVTVFSRINRNKTKLKIFFEFHIIDCVQLYFTNGFMNIVL